MNNVTIEQTSDNVWHIENKYNETGSNKRFNTGNFSLLNTFNALFVQILYFWKYTF